MKALEELEDLIKNECLTTNTKLEKFKEWKDKYVRQWHSQHSMDPWTLLMYSDPEERLASVLQWMQHDLIHKMAEDADLKFDIKDTEDGGKKVSAVLTVIK